MDGSEVSEYCQSLFKHTNVRKLEEPWKFWASWRCACSRLRCLRYFPGSMHLRHRSVSGIRINPFCVSFMFKQWFSAKTQNLSPWTLLDTRCAQPCDLHSSLFTPALVSASSSNWLLKCLEDAPVDPREGNGCCSVKPETHHPGHVSPGFLVPQLISGSQAGPTYELIH